MSAAAEFKVTLRGFDIVDARLGQFSDIELTSLSRGVAGKVHDQTAHRLTEGKTAPDGSAWAELSPRYSLWKKKHYAGIGMMELHGDLRDALDTWVEPTSAEIGVEATSSMVYAGAHQYGSSKNNLPARPFIGLSTDDEDELERLIDHWLLEVFA